MSVRQLPGAPSGLVYKTTVGLQFRAPANSIFTTQNILSITDKMRFSLSFVVAMAASVLAADPFVINTP